MKLYTAVFLQVSEFLKNKVKFGIEDVVNSLKNKSGKDIPTNKDITYDKVKEIVFDYLTHNVFDTENCKFEFFFKDTPQQNVNESIQNFFEDKPQQPDNETVQNYSLFEKTLTHLKEKTASKNLLDKMITDIINRKNDSMENKNLLDKLIADIMSGNTSNENAKDDNTDNYKDFHKEKEVSEPDEQLVISDLFIPMETQNRIINYMSKYSSKKVPLDLKRIQSAVKRNNNNLDKNVKLTCEILYKFIKNCLNRRYRISYANDGHYSKALVYEK